MSTVEGVSRKIGAGVTRNGNDCCGGGLWAATTGRVDEGVCAERQVVVAQALAMIAVACAFR